MQRDPVPVTKGPPASPNVTGNDPDCIAVTLGTADPCSSAQTSGHTLCPDPPANMREGTGAVKPARPTPRTPATSPAQRTNGHGAD
jgi:hypothetical protein